MIKKLCSFTFRSPSSCCAKGTRPAVWVSRKLNSSALAVFLDSYFWFARTIGSATDSGWGTSRRLEALRLYLSGLLLSDRAFSTASQIESNISYFVNPCARSVSSTIAIAAEGSGMPASSGCKE